MRRERPRRRERGQDYTTRLPCNPGPALALGQVTRNDGTPFDTVVANNEAYPNR